MRKLASLTSPDNYFEDFEVGQTIRHQRGKTMTNLENVNITNMVMNSASGHFDEHFMSKTPLEKILCFGGVNLSLSLGLASQDTVENALAEISMENVNFRAPVTHGDTLYAYSRVLEKRDSDRDDAGIVVFQHWGVNHRDEIVVEAQRTALIKRKSHWANK